MSGEKNRGAIKMGKQLEKSEDLLVMLMPYRHGRSKKAINTNSLHELCNLNKEKNRPTEKLRSQFFAPMLWKTKLCVYISIRSYTR